MNRYVLRYQGSETPPGPDLQRIRGLSGLNVVDESSAHMLLVEATDAAVRQVKQMPSWVVSPETFVPLPDARRKARRPI
jgi:hypothetical protein